MIAHSTDCFPRGRVVRRQPLAMLVATALSFAWPSLAAADSPGLGDPQSNILSKIEFNQRLDQPVPLDLPFYDETGARVRLGSYFGEQPVILALVYYRCPKLCNLVLQGAVKATRGIDFQAGEEYRVVLVSIDPNETPAEAAAKKRAYFGSHRPKAGDGWHFLTGNEDDIARLADAVGFRYEYDERSGQYAHASGIMIVTPAGRLSRYFYGIDYSTRDLRLGLVEASQHRIGSPVDQLLLYCFHYDPLTGQYSLAIMNVVRIAGLLTVLALSSTIYCMLRSERSAGELIAERSDAASLPSKLHRPLTAR